MSEFAIDAVEYLDRLWMDPGSVVCGYWSDFCRACVIGGPAKVQCDAQGAILEVNQGHPSCTRPTFADSNMHHDDRDKPALGPATDPLVSIPILLQQRRSVGCFTYWCWFRPSPPRSRFAPTRSSSPMRERRGSMPRSCPSSRWRTGAGGCIATSCGSSRAVRRSAPASSSPTRRRSSRWVPGGCR